MKKTVFLFLLSLLPMCLKGQIFNSIIYTTTLSTGFPMSEPSYTPFTWQVIASYPLSKRLSTGIGTGISCYEKVLVPFIANGKFLLTYPHKFTPYLDCSVGYAFAPDSEANGGFYLNPNIGIQYETSTNLTLLFAIGYELQELERLKEYENQYLAAQFSERLKHHSISLKIGLIF